MRKIVTLLLLSFLAFGCNKNTALTTESIVGTIWVADFGTSSSPDLIAIEFVSNTKVKSYHTDDYLAERYPIEGTYSLKGKEVTFNLEIYHWVSHYATKGTISDNLMSVEIYSIGASSGDKYTETKRFIRKK